MLNFKSSLLTLFFSLSFAISTQLKSTEYVVGKLFGQLGNQMFQIAAATSLAIDNGAIATFPDLENEQRYNLPLNRSHVFKNLNAFTPEVDCVYKEVGFEFNPIPYTPNIQIEGYFQSEKYFKHNKEAILKLFEPSDEILSYLKEKYSHIIDHPNTVAIHVRTYKDTTSDCHPFVGWNYIQKATKHFDKETLFVIFSDDIWLCKKKLRKILPEKHLIFIEGNSHYHDLYLISLCKNQIMSNSSFSWWGAYLNKNPGKKIICPKPENWFGPILKNLNTTNLPINNSILI